MPQFVLRSQALRTSSLVHTVVRPTKKREKIHNYNAPYITLH